MPHSISAVVLAAGQSRRMGLPKMILPWGETTVIGQVVSVLQSADCAEILVVTGGYRAEVEAALEPFRVRCVYNPHFANGEMVQSLQIGLHALGSEPAAALVALGDQPHIEETVVRLVMAAYQQRRAPLVIPSYQMRRGHPWIVDRSLWPEILNIQASGTLRDVIQAHQKEIEYVTVEQDNILSDLDTPEDYDRDRPRFGS